MTYKVSSETLSLYLLAYLPDKQINLPQLTTAGYVAIHKCDLLCVHVYFAFPSSGRQREMLPISYFFQLKVFRQSVKILRSYHDWGTTCCDTVCADLIW